MDPNYNVQHFWLKIDEGTFCNEDIQEIVKQVKGISKIKTENNDIQEILNDIRTTINNGFAKSSERHVSNVKSALNLIEKRILTLDLNSLDFLKHIFTEVLKRL